MLGRSNHRLGFRLQNYDQNSLVMTGLQPNYDESLVLSHLINIVFSTAVFMGSICILNYPTNLSSCFFCSYVHKEFDLDYYIYHFVCISSIPASQPDLNPFLLKGPPFDE